MTVISVEGDKTDRLFDDRNLIILPRTKPLDKNDEVDRFAGVSHHLYYRGVRVMRIPHALFTWSVTRKCDLTEDRTLKYNWQGHDAVARLILKSADRRLITACITAPDGSYEEQLDYNNCGLSSEPSEQFLEVVRDLSSRGTRIAAKAQSVAETALGVLSPDTTEEMTSIERQKLDRAKHIVEKLGGRPDDFPIKVVNSLGPGVYGRAHEGEIWLAKFAFEQGVKMLASTLYEEWVHLQHGYEDLSRPMQNFLFDRLLTLLEEHVLGEPI